MPDQEAARWNAMYTSGLYREHWDSRHASPYLAAMVAAGVTHAGKTTLDIGCGGGRNAIFLAQMGCRSIGLDWSAEALRIAAARADEAGVEVEWREGDALATPFENASIDFVIDNGCLHGIPLDDWPRYAAELVRILASGGHFLLAGGAQAGEAARTAITEAHIDSAFGALLQRGPVTPVIARSDAGELQANICLMHRR